MTERNPPKPNSNVVFGLNVAALTVLYVAAAVVYQVAPEVFLAVLNALG